MNFKIYSKENCPYCYKVKTVLEMTGTDFQVHKLGKDFTQEEFYAKFGKESTFPQVMCDDEKLGGCVDTIKFLRERQVIKS
jgi:glutaredoxin